jgi:hypothetical protein
MRQYAWVILFCVCCDQSAFAQPAYVESEPNHAPPTFNEVSGAVRIMGTMPPGDQDGFLWSVSDVDAVKPWTFTLQGIPGALTVAEVMRLEYAEDGVTLAGRETLFTIGSRDGSRPGVAEGLLFEPGDYFSDWPGRAEAVRIARRSTVPGLERWMSWARETRVRRETKTRTAIA